MANILKYTMLMRGQDSIDILASDYQDLKYAWEGYIHSRKNRSIDYAEFSFMASDIKGFRPLTYGDDEGSSRPPAYKYWKCGLCEASVPTGENCTCNPVADKYKDPEFIEWFKKVWRNSSIKNYPTVHDAYLALRDKTDDMKDIELLNSIAVKL